MKTSDAVEMIKREMAENPELASMVTEELQRLRIAEKIRQARKHAGLSQSELAKRIKTTQSVVSRLESSHYERFSLNTLVKISRVLECNLIIDLQPHVSH